MSTEAADKQTKARTICLVGNPNTGKSVLFGVLTGSYVTVSNYPGTTVEVLKGSAHLAGGPATIVDTPGTNSLIPMSEDEKVTRDILMQSPPDVVLQVGDAKNLKRVLAVTLQLMELGLPMVLALNMTDEASARGIQVDTEKLSDLLGIPVVPTVAVERKGLDILLKALEAPARPAPPVEYPNLVNRAVEEIAALLPETCPAPQAAALMYLAGDDSITDLLGQWAPGKTELIEDIRARVQAKCNQGCPRLISHRRQQRIDALYSEVVSRVKGQEGPVASLLGRSAMHPIWGVPFLLFVLWAMWKFVGEIGAGGLVDFIEEGIFGGYVNPWAIALFAKVPIQFIQDLFVGEYGIITMALTYGIAIVMPVVFTFFLAFGFLEDSGYLPRLAIMVNQIFKKMGLNGKAVLPMVLGLGCDTMATLTTRILETRRERTIVILLLALGVPCSAQLGVILAMLTSFQSVLIWGGVVLSVLLVVGYLAGKVMPGHSSDFIMEVPPMRLPKVKNILVKTLARTEWYIKEAIPLFVLGTLVLFILDKIHVLGFIEQACAPVVTGVLGLPVETTQAFIMGFLRRDYGGAGLMMLYNQGLLTGEDVLVSLIVITLFVPCVANFLVMIKEQGVKVAFAMALFIVPTAVLVGGLVRLVLNLGIF